MAIDIVCNSENSLEEKQVLDVVKQYVNGSYEADIPMLVGAFHDNATMFGYLDGNLVEGTPEIYYADLGSKPSLKESGADFKSVIEHITVTGNVANVVVRETGFGPFNFNDYLQLLKKNGEWKIINKTFTTY